MSAKIIAKQVSSKDLEPGDLFSYASPDYWKNFEDKESIGEKVYIRTFADSDEEVAVHKIEILKEGTSERELAKEIIEQLGEGESFSFHNRHRIAFTGSLPTNTVSKDINSLLPTDTVSKDTNGQLWLTFSSGYYETIYWASRKRTRISKEEAISHLRRHATELQL